MSTRTLDAAHLETIRDLANARDRDDASIDEITLRAALAETVAETDRLHDQLRAAGVEPAGRPVATPEIRPGCTRADYYEPRAFVHPDLVHFDLRRPYREWPETVRALIAERQREAGEVKP
jgi:hypothetical protein